MFRARLKLAYLGEELFKAQGMVGERMGMLTEAAVDQPCLDRVRPEPRRA